MATKYTKKQLDKMSVRQLQPIALKLATTYYNSDSCNISFGNRTPSQVASILVAQASKTSLIKDIMSFQKAVK